MANVHLVPQRGFNQHVARRFRAPGRLATHDTGERFHALLVGNDAHGLIECIGLAVEREQAFARARAAHREIASDFRRVEHMERASAVVGYQVRNIDQCVDRPKPDGGQAALQPFGRGAVLDASHPSQRKGRAQRWRRAEIERHPDRAGKLALDRLNRRVLELAHVGGGEIARDTMHARTVRPIRRQIDFNDGIIEMRPFGIAHADRRFRRQIKNTFVVIGQLELECRAQHAAALDPADRADTQRHILARDEAAGRCEHADHAGARIGRPTNDLDRFTCAGVDHA